MRTGNSLNHLKFGSSNWNMLGDNTFSILLGWCGKFKTFNLTLITEGNDTED